MTFLNLGKAGQSSLEFTIIIGFALLLASGFLIVFESSFSSADTDRESDIVDQFYNLILSEFEFADMSYPVYNRVFYLPQTVGGFNYSLNLIDGVELVMDYRGFEHVRFLTSASSVTGDFQKGRNDLIKLDNDIIQLNEVSLIPSDWCDPEVGIVINDLDPALCWQKNIHSHNINHANAVFYCQELVLEGFEEVSWDIPTKSELVALRNYACEHKTESVNCNPVSCTTAYCSGVAQANLHIYLNSLGFYEFVTVSTYWTSTHFPLGPSKWVVDLRTGEVDTRNVQSSLRVLCVYRSES